MKEALKWAAFILLAAVAMLAFCTLAGDIAPESDMGIWEFLAWKGGAGAVIYSAWRAGLWLHGKGLLPDSVSREIRKAEAGREEA